MPRQATRTDPPHVVMQKRANAELSTDFSRIWDGGKTPLDKMSDDALVSITDTYEKVFYQGYDNYEWEQARKALRVLYPLLQSKGLLNRVKDYREYIYIQY